MVGYQLDDDSKSLHRKWLEITKNSLKNGCLGFQKFCQNVNLSPVRQGVLLGEDMIEPPNHDLPSPSVEDTLPCFTLIIVLLV